MSSLDWRFLSAMPAHLVAQRVAPESVTIDGHLDDPVWRSVDWATRNAPLVDITAHANSTLNAVPDRWQLRAKLLWDEAYLYVGVELRESFITANVTGHNGPAVPYADNDFEMFFDVAGSAQYYKEFEMSAYGTAGPL